MTTPTGSTRLAAVIGTPVTHSLSPAIFNAAFRADDLDWVFVAFEVQPSGLPDAVAGVRALGIAGLSVTMPHKEAIVPLLDGLTPDAEALGAVNSVRRDGDRLVGHNTDGAGLVDAVRTDLGVVPDGRRCVVLGAGGAARAVVRALAGAGAAQVAVVGRTPARVERAVALAGPVGCAAPIEAVREADLIVNATPVGMGDDRSLPLDPELLHEGQVVVDLVYHPLETELVRHARARGVQAANGVGMLVHQAAHQYAAWTGRDAPLPAMVAAVAAHLA